MHIYTHKSGLNLSFQQCQFIFFSYHYHWQKIKFSSILLNLKGKAIRGKYWLLLIVINYQLKNKTTILKISNKSMYFLYLHWPCFTFKVNDNHVSIQYFLKMWIFLYKDIQDFSVKQKMLSYMTCQSLITISVLYTKCRLNDTKKNTWY